MLVVATGASNGFWRHDRVEGVDEVEALAAGVGAPRTAPTVAVVGGGATGVSVADNLARRAPGPRRRLHGAPVPQR